jgi:hypothetical protein
VYLLLVMAAAAVLAQVADGRRLSGEQQQQQRRQQQQQQQQQRQVMPKHRNRSQLLVQDVQLVQQLLTQELLQLLQGNVLLVNNQCLDSSNSADNALHQAHCHGPAITAQSLLLLLPRHVVELLTTACIGCCCCCCCCCCCSYQARAGRMHCGHLRAAAQYNHRLQHLRWRRRQCTHLPWLHTRWFTRGSLPALHIEHDALESSSHEPSVHILPESDCGVIMIEVDLEQNPELPLLTVHGDVGIHKVSGA